MTQAGYYCNNSAENCTEMYGKSFCGNMSYTAYAALVAVCVFLFALMAVIIGGAIISVIICVAIINVIIIRPDIITAREVYQS